MSMFNYTSIGNLYQLSATGSDLADWEARGSLLREGHAA